MVLTIFDDIGNLANSLVNLLSYIMDGFGNLINLIFHIPTLIPNLVECIPQPFCDIIGAFIGVVIVVILIRITIRLKELIFRWT